MIRARETLQCSIKGLAQMLLNEPIGWIESFLRISCIEGEESAARFFGANAGERPEGPRSVRVMLGEVGIQNGSGNVAIPFAWRVHGYRAVPASFEGTLTLSPTADDVTDVAIAGGWELEDPAGAGPRIDAVRTAAEACVHRLLATLRIALEERANTNA